jgi:hypothetical protein
MHNRMMLPRPDFSPYHSDAADPTPRRRPQELMEGYEEGRVMRSEPSMAPASPVMVEPVELTET